jgi:hypothetical protein
MRDILFGDKQHLLDNQILVFVPIYNADGNDAMAENSRPNQELSPGHGRAYAPAHGYDFKSRWHDHGGRMKPRRFTAM